jgi:hypothetical protein
MQAHRKSDPIEPINRLEVIQDDRGRSGLRTIQLHSYIPPDEKKRTRKVIDIPIVDLKDKPVEQVAKIYLIACEESLTDSETSSSQDSDFRGFVDRENPKIKDRMQGEKDSPWRSKDNTSGSLVKAESTPVLDRVQVGKVRQLKYPGIPTTQEISFTYECDSHAVYGASARIELTEESQLISATIILPDDMGEFKYDPAAPIKDLKQDVLPIVRKESGHSAIQEEWAEDSSLKWYFDDNQKVWTMAYIVENVVKLEECKDRGNKQEVKAQKHNWGMLQLPIVDYVINAYVISPSGDLIAEI